MLTTCTVDELIRILKQDLEYRSSTTITPFQITGEQFRDFAIEDSKIDSVHNRVNALGNAKRAIECRIGEILYGVCLHVKSEKESWNFPQKIQVLGDIGVLAPRILKKINRKRNQLEHEYVKPTKDDVEDALDVAILFIGYTDKFLKSCTVSFGCGDTEIDIDREKGFFSVKKNKNTRKLKIADEDSWIEVAKFFIGSIR